MASNQIGDLKESAIAVAIDKDKMSQYAMKWAVDHILSRGQTVALIHVKQRISSIASPNEDVCRSGRPVNNSQSREIFIPFRCFCTRKNIKCKEIILDDTDISKALINYVQLNSIEILVLGASSRNGLISRRFKGPDVATNLSKSAPEFCTVYVISKGKILSVRTATCPIPKLSNRAQSQGEPFPKVVSLNESHPMDAGAGGFSRGEKAPFAANNSDDQTNMIRSPFTRGSGTNGRPYGELSMPESDISFVSSSRPSTERMSIDQTLNDHGLFDVIDFKHGPRLSTGSDFDQSSSGSPFSDRRSMDQNSFFSYSSNCSGFSSSSLSCADDVESEMRRLRLELKQTMEMYNTACREAMFAKQKANDIQKSKIEENQRLEEIRLAEEAAKTAAEKEQAKCKAAFEAAEAAQRIAELESQKRMSIELKALEESEETKNVHDSLSHGVTRYRKYSIEEIEIATDNFSQSLKIGEGGYGPVYKAILDHTPVAIKVLRPDAAQGQSQFNQEVEILSCIRHPNMVLLLGACPEYGCLVYEHLSNGSLEDRLLCKGNTRPLPWQLRFRIAAEIGTGLLFLHQTKPEPLVHRDLKPGNILLDRNYVSKISDVGLARLVPPTMADSVTQYRMTQTAGTFCYIDPEYQQTGMLGTKSDVYSLGILFLQLITAKPAMGLAHHVQRAIERGTFREMLDPAVPDWPYEETLNFAKLSLQCAELRRKDRPDLATVVLPELERLRDLAEESMSLVMYNAITAHTTRPSHALRSLDEISESQSMQFGMTSHSTASSSRSRTSLSSTTEM